MKKYLLAATLFLSSYAHAGVFAEPFLGYDDSTVSFTTKVSGLSASSKNSGFDYGARLGYYFGPAFWVAAEYAGGSGKNKAGSAEGDYSKTAMSAIFGYKLKEVNLWFGYGVSDKITYKGSTSEVYYSGTNMKFGFGREVAKHVAINAELLIPSYKKFGDGTLEANIDDAFSKYTVTGIMVSVSFPFGASK